MQDNGSITSDPKEQGEILINQYNSMASLPKKDVVVKDAEAFLMRNNTKERDEDKENSEYEPLPSLLEEDYAEENYEDEEENVGDECSMKCVDCCEGRAL